MPFAQGTIPKPTHSHKTKWKNDWILVNASIKRSSFESIAAFWAMSVPICSDCCLTLCSNSIDWGVGSSGQRCLFGTVCFIGNEKTWSCFVQVGLFWARGIVWKAFVFVLQSRMVFQSSRQTTRRWMSCCVEGKKKLKNNKIIITTIRRRQAISLNWKKNIHNTKTKIRTLFAFNDAGLIEIPRRETPSYLRFQSNAFCSRLLLSGWFGHEPHRNKPQTSAQCHRNAQFVGKLRSIFWMSKREIWIWARTELHR